MTNLRSTFIVAFLPSLGLAQDTVVTEQAVLERLIYSTCIHVHPAPGCEELLLLSSEDYPDTADLFIMRNGRDMTGTDDRTILVARNIVYRADHREGSPWIDPVDDGGFAVMSGEVGHGPHPWTQTLVINWHENDLRVTHFSFTSYDRLSLDAYYCSIELLTGAFEAETVLVQGDSEEVFRDSGESSPLAIAAADWGEQWSGPAACAEMAEIYYTN